MLIGEKMKEISTKISFPHENHSEKLTTTGSGNYYVPKQENKQYKVENCIQSNKEIVLFLFAYLKIIAVKSSGCMVAGHFGTQQEMWS